MFRKVLKQCGVAAIVFCLGLMAATAFAAGYKTATKQDILNFVTANKGNVVVMNVFASWCPPCRRETPDLVRFYKQTVSGNDVVFFGVSMDESGPDLEEFITKFQIPYPVFQAEEEFLGYLESYSVPQLLIFDRSGKKVLHEVGMVSFEELMSLVAPYVADRSVL